MTEQFDQGVQTKLVDLASQQVVEAWLGDPEPLPVIDSLIAATAIVHGLAMVPRNISDFERCGVACIYPWDR